MGRYKEKDAQRAGHTRAGRVVTWKHHNPTSTSAYGRKVAYKSSRALRYERPRRRCGIYP